MLVYAGSFPPYAKKIIGIVNHSILLLFTSTITPRITFTAFYTIVNCVAELDWERSAVI